jgi:methylglutaconyl-CoA hydratase
MLSEFVRGVESVQRAAEVKAVNVLIVSSSVPNVFSAGADLKERQGMAESEVAGFVDSLRQAFTLLENLSVPTIAAIEGAALGGGLELALCCDLRIAGRNAILGLPETALAIIPGAGGTQRLPRLIGPSKAKELVYLARRLSADEALMYGIINERVDAGKAVERAQDMANIMAGHGPIALRMAKKAIDAGWLLRDEDMVKALEVERDCYACVVSTADRREGLKAFVEKRKALYRGE